MQIGAHRLQKQPEAVANAHRQRKNQSAANENGVWSAPRGRGHRMAPMLATIANVVASAAAMSTRCDGALLNIIPNDNGHGRSSELVNCTHSRRPRMGHAQFFARSTALFHSAVSLNA